MSGDIWSVTPVPPAEYQDIPAPILRQAEDLLIPWSGTCQDACALAGVRYSNGWLTPRTGKLADELGAPVGQAVRTVLLRDRA